MPGARRRARGRRLAGPRPGKRRAGPGRAGQWGSSGWRGQDEGAELEAEGHLTAFFIAGGQFDGLEPQSQGFALGAPEEAGEAGEVAGGIDAALVGGVIIGLALPLAVDVADADAAVLGPGGDGLRRPVVRRRRCRW